VVSLKDEIRVLAVKYRIGVGISVKTWGGFKKYLENPLSQTKDLYES
jgi:hypothetical protein